MYVSAVGAGAHLPLPSPGSWRNSVNFHLPVSLDCICVPCVWSQEAARAMAPASMMMSVRIWISFAAKLFFKSEYSGR